MEIWSTPLPINPLADLITNLQKLGDKLCSMIDCCCN